MYLILQANGEKIEGDSHIAEQKDNTEPTRDESNKSTNTINGQGEYNDFQSNINNNQSTIFMGDLIG